VTASQGAWYAQRAVRGPRGAPRVPCSTALRHHYDPLMSQSTDQALSPTIPQGHAVGPPAGEYELIDLFAGSGAFTLGLRQAGITGRALLVDRARDCVATCRLNHADAHVLQADVSLVDWAGVSAGVVVGGPPCQGFSALGLRNDADARNDLYLGMLRCVELTSPDMVVVENVPRFLAVQQGADLITSLRRLGYSVRADVVDCASFGTPQRRRRALVAAARDGMPIPWPAARFGPGSRPLRTVADAFAMLPGEPDGANWHISAPLSSEYEERIRAIPPGGSRLDLPSDLLLDCWRRARGHGDVMGRLRWSRPATTLRTEFFRPEKGRFLHPSEDRALTLREGARLQAFPDSYAFPTDLALYTIARQIGNAIPPPLAHAIGDSMAGVRRILSRPAANV
jgi:DNA (cytosine-5)-methyltransferase 1